MSSRIRCMFTHAIRLLFRNEVTCILNKYIRPVPLLMHNAGDFVLIVVPRSCRSPTETQGTSKRGILNKS